MKTRDSDEYLQEAARAMESAASAGRSVAMVLKRLCPLIHQQVARDGRCPALFRLWGRSANFDENARTTIVHAAILAAIGRVAGVPMRGRFVHAGLQHTYGYLFSLIETPYGAKRERWVTKHMEHGLGLEESLLGESPRAGTLLANLSYFLGRIVLGKSRRLRCLEESRGAIAPELIGYDYDHLGKERVVETAGLASGREVMIFTDLVPYVAPRADMRETVLLVYSVRTGKQPVRLITVFPVAEQVAAGIIDAVPASGRGPIQLKYNAYVPGLYGRTLTGRRWIE